jgi:hypothetical protein
MPSHYFAGSVRLRLVFFTLRAPPEPVIMRITIHIDRIEIHIHGMPCPEPYAVGLVISAEMPEPVRTIREACIVQLNNKQKITLHVVGLLMSDQSQAPIPPGTTYAWVASDDTIVSLEPADSSCNVVTRDGVTGEVDVTPTATLPDATSYSSTVHFSVNDGGGGPVEPHPIGLAVTADPPVDR